MRVQQTTATNCHYSFVLAIVVAAVRAKKVHHPQKLTNVVAEDDDDDLQLKQLLLTKVKMIIPQSGVDPPK
jgi:hypothetical protein